MKEASQFKEAKEAKELELLGVGIDVSKETLAVALVYEGKTEQYIYTNDEAGIEQLRAKLEGATGKYKIVMESTARYHFLVAMRLSEAGLDVRVINPLLAKRYCSLIFP